MKKILLSLIFSCFTYVTLAAQAIPVSSVEYQALVDFYNSAGGSGWNTKWDINNNSIHLNSWAGVKAENGHVVEISLRNNNYRGTFPITFNNLRYLRKLDLGGYYYNINDFSQANLDNLSGLESLEYLDLGYSRIKSKLPSSWGKLINLKALHIYNNEFFDDIPNEFGELKKLENISFQNNKFTSLPSTVANLTKLVNANFSYNNFAILNKEFENISTLKSLDFSNNNISDVLPILPLTVSLPLHSQVVYQDSFVFTGDDVVLANLPKITRYSREKNNLSALNNFRFYLRNSDMGVDCKMNADGTLIVPKSVIGSIRKGDEVYLYQNTGSASSTKIYFKNITISQPAVPDAEYQALVDFYAAAGGAANWYNKWDTSKNNLNEGSWYGVSVENGHIVSLNLYGNNLRGTIPPSFSNVKFLRSLNLGGQYYNIHDFSTADLNSLSGLESLESLDLSYCNLKGAIPDSFNKLSRLTNLNVSNNQLTSLFNTIGDLKELTGLYATYNQITSIPVGIGNNTKLQYFDINNNKITKVIKELENLATLKRLSIFTNEITDIEAKLPTTISMPIYNQTNYIDNFEYTGADYKVIGISNVTRYSRSKNDFSELNNFRLYLRNSDVGAEFKMAADGSITIPKQYLLSLKKGDKLYLYQNNGTAYSTYIHFKNVTVNQPPIPQEEYQALVDFYNSANGKNWHNKWDVSYNNLHEGSWYGVSVENGHVVELNLPNNNIRGNITQSFSNLKFLRKIVLAGQYYNHHDLSTADLNRYSFNKIMVHLMAQGCIIKITMLIYLLFRMKNIGH